MRRNAAKSLFSWAKIKPLLLQALKSLVLPAVMVTAYAAILLTLIHLWRKYAGLSTETETGDVSSRGPAIALTFASLVPFFLLGFLGYHPGIGLIGLLLIIIGYQFIFHQDRIFEPEEPEIEEEVFEEVESDELDEEEVSDFSLDVPSEDFDISRLYAAQQEMETEPEEKPVEPPPVDEDTTEREPNVEVPLLSEKEPPKPDPEISALAMIPEPTEETHEETAPQKQEETAPETEPEDSDQPASRTTPETEESSEDKNDTDTPSPDKPEEDRKDDT